MSVFSLTSDNEFITPSKIPGAIYVRKCNGDTNDFRTIGKGYGGYEHGPWGDTVRVGPTEQKYKALEVFGTRIEGDAFKKLVTDLKAIQGKGCHIRVNRLGLCVIIRVQQSWVKCMRLNDCFGWSKYGVRVPQDMILPPATAWNRFDMCTGATMMDVRGLVHSADQARKLLEEKKVELATCKKQLEENSLELTSCNKELEWVKKESKQELQQILDEKSVELTACKKQLEEEKIAELTTFKKEMERVKKESEDKTLELATLKKEMERREKMGLEKDVELATCKKELEEKKVDLAACKRELEEKSTELMTWRQKELEWSKKMESVLTKLVEEKEKVEELTKDKQLALKADHRDVEYLDFSY